MLTPAVPPVLGTAGLVSVATRWTVLLLVCLLAHQVDHCDGFNTVFNFNGDLEEAGTGESGSQWTRVSMQLPTQQDGIVFRPTRPISIYGRSVDTLTVFRNGLIGLDDESVNNLPHNYPANSETSGKRLQHLNGRYLSVFSSMNDGTQGLIQVSEANLTGRPPLACKDIRQLNRLHEIIRLSYPTDANFLADMAVWVTWENMTANSLGADKINSYRLLLLMNSHSTYAVLQYQNITWPQLDEPVLNSLPPEAGIFMRPHGGFQLPRSGHSVNVDLWTTESNIGIPGEWIIPMNDIAVNSQQFVLRKLPEIVSRFLANYWTPCTGVEAIEGVPPAAVMHDSPRDAGNSSQRGIETRSGFPEGYSYPFVADYDYGDAMMYGENANLSNSDPTAVTPEYNDTMVEEPDEATEEFPMSSFDGNENRVPVTEAEIVPETFIPLEDRNRSVHVTNLAAPGQGRSVLSSECGEGNRCKDTNAECVSVNGVTCCVCRPGYFGAGAERCWHADEDEKFVFNGHLVARFDSQGYVATLPVYLDVQHGQLKRSSSGFRSGRKDDPSYATLRFITPVFHVLNSLIASSCSNGSWSSVDQVFSVFTLADAFRVPLEIQFTINIDYVGELLLNAKLLLDHDSVIRGFASGNLSIEVTTGQPIRMVTRHYKEMRRAPANGNNNNNTSYFTSYYVDAYKRIVFPNKSVTFKAEDQATQGSSEPDQLSARWSAVASLHGGSRTSDGCLLRAESVVPQSKQMFIRLKEKGYCSEECSDANSSCNLFCIDEPLLMGHEPGSCDCVQCETDGEICVPEGGSYSCTCRPGLRRMEDRTCRPDETHPAAYVEQPKACGTVLCHQNAKCLDYNQSLCQCLPGFRGDGIHHCEEDPCARCRPDEVCLNDTCTPSGIDLCRDVRCGKNAICQEGACICLPGFTGEPMDRCVEEGELCAGVKCHQFGQCYENRCYCSHGYVGDGVNFCDKRSEDKCIGVRCAKNGRCHDGQCTCDPGYEGDGYHECRPQDRCAGVQCHAYAQCYDGQCQCITGYQGDGYRDCTPTGQDKACASIRCHPDAQCQNGQCFCRPGYYGDGYYECIREAIDPCQGIQCHHYAMCANGHCRCRPGYQGDGYHSCYPTGVYEPSQCSQCRGMPVNEIAQCIDGKCVCVPGFVQLQTGLCVECVHGNCHANAECKQNAQYSGAYSCQCNPGYTGDGIQSCVPTGGIPVDPTCGGGCRVKNAECNPSTGKCHCRPGYRGDGVSSCHWDCSRCAANAQCDVVSERCTCNPGYFGDGVTYCEFIPEQPDLVKVVINIQGGVLRVTDLNQPVELKCRVTTREQSLTGKWILPDAAQTPTIKISRLSDGMELLLTISQPTLSDAGRYTCRAGNVEEHVDVVIEETAIAYDIFLTSDDGILKVKSTGKNLTTATLWNIAENNKYGPVAMVADCKAQSIIYTSDYGHTIRLGKTTKELNDNMVHTMEVVTSQLSKFKSLAVDPPSGNIFTWDEANSKIVVVNPKKPHMRYTLESINSLPQDKPVRVAGIALHPNKGLLYWAMFTDGWRPNGTIQVASMSGANEDQVLQLSAEPLAILLVPFMDTTGGSAGRLCWIQRSINSIFNIATELHCARLSADGRHILSQERVRRFMASEEPSWGLTHYQDTTLWTDASKTVYYSTNPTRRVKVYHVCCSNRFQAIAVMAKCHPAMKNPCSFSNGRCQYFCFPGEDGLSRTCVCPDGEPGCHREI